MGLVKTFMIWRYASEWKSFYSQLNIEHNFKAIWSKKSLLILYHKTIKLNKLNVYIIMVFINVS